MDHHTLKAQSLAAHGFKDRATAWQHLLHIPSSSLQDEDTKPETTDEVHQDERQIKLDTQRSFVLYPDPVDGKSREDMQEELHTLLVSIFRKRPKLSYFQGYHDIVTVLLLTLPPEIQLLAAEKVSLFRVRDSMGSGLEPVLGLLRVLRNLLRVADPSYAQLLEQTSPLPYHALPNLLTLFAHDTPTLPLIQHIFDWILCRNPICTVYLAAAIILARKSEVERLEEEGEEGMVHSVLTGLGGLVDSELSLLPTPSQEVYLPLDSPPEPKEEGPLEPTQSNTSSTDVGDFKEPSHTSIVDDSLMSSDANDATLTTARDSVETTAPSFSDDDTTLLDEDIEAQKEDVAQNPPVADDLPKADSPAISALSLQAAADDLHKTASPTISPPTLQNDTTLADDHNASSPDHEEEADIPLPTTSPSKILGRSQTSPLILTRLLAEADFLYELYPPTHPALRLSSIVGPASVISTWTEDGANEDADKAEDIVLNPTLVVLPDDEGQKKEKPRSRGSSNNGVFLPLTLSFWRGKSARRRRLLTYVASAIVVLGFAMVFYRKYPTHTARVGLGTSFASRWRVLILR